jgi:hypothetical protein
MVVAVELASMLLPMEFTPMLLSTEFRCLLGVYFSCIRSLTAGCVSADSGRFFGIASLPFDFPEAKPQRDRYHNHYADNSYNDSRYGASTDVRT